jgi:hypothetical protein
MCGVKGVETTGGGAKLLKVKKRDWVGKLVYRGIFFFLSGGVKKIQLWTEGRENRNLGAVNWHMNETRVPVRLLRMYIPRNWEFDSAL